MNLYIALRKYDEALKLARTPGIKREYMLRWATGKRP